MTCDGMFSVTLALALLLPLLGAIAVMGLSRHARWAGPVSLAVLLATAVSLGLAWHGREGEIASLACVPTLGPGLTVALRLDGLALPFVANLMGVALLALWYALGYLQHARRPEWCYALLLLFIGSMLGALLADDLLLFLVFWEGMLLASSLLLLGWGESADVARITLRYFVYTQAGSLLLLAGMAWLAWSSGSTRPLEIAAAMHARAPASLVPLAAVLLLGFGVKMAVVPLHGWLADAHAIAPMPVTVLLAAAMLAMGAYGILRFVLQELGAPALAPLQVPLMVVGLVSQVYGALQSLAAKDIKRIIAYSSVSQMGYVLFGVAALSALGVGGSVYHVVSHGAVKSLLFMAVGVIIAGTHRRNVEELGDLGHLLPGAALGLGIGLLALSGAPPLAAFHSEWRILQAGLATQHPFLGAAAFAAPLLTLAYGLALMGRLVLSPAPVGLSSEVPPRSMLASTAAAIALTLVLGLLGGPLGSWIEALLPVSGGAL